eukprot:578929_1
MPTISSMTTATIPSKTRTTTMQSKIPTKSPTVSVSPSMSRNDSKSDYSDCKWFGNRTNVPLFPIDVCSAHSHETELDGLTLYSTRMECTDNGELNQYEWDNTDCADLPYHTQTYRKEDGYYFNCDAKTSCPFAKIILWDLSDFGPTGNTSGHNDHICAWDSQKYHEISI